MAILQTTVALLSGSGSWLVPANCVSIDLIEAYGAGGGGRCSVNWAAGPGGGGGAYSASNPFTLAPGTSIYYAVGAAGLGGAVFGTDGGSGGDTWLRWDGTNNLPAALGQGLLARGGKGGGTVDNITGGLGGAAADGIGDIKFSGGKGGNCANYYGAYPGGGGGASGSHLRNGGNGRGIGETNSDGGGGGGIGDPSWINAFMLSVGGPAVDKSTSLFADGLSGVEGGGGASGARYSEPTNPYKGGVLYRLSTYGPAGGGGGGGASSGRNGGNGGGVTAGGFGGGGGGNGGATYNSSYNNGIGGNGAPGGILISYSYTTEPLPPTSFPGAIIPFL